MMKKNVLVVAAGAALGLSSFALAQSADQSRAYASEMLADASGRESFAADSTVIVGGQIQFRYVINNRDNVAGSDDDTTTGFQTRRTKIWVYGDVGENFSYKVVGAFDREDGVFGLEDAFVNYAANDDWTVTWGQFKLPTLREENVSSAKQLAVERSIMNEVFNQDRSQGVMATYANDSWRFRGAVSDGLSTRNTDFTSGAEADFALTGRLDYRWGAGDWARFDDFTSWKGQEYGGLVGGAFHWQSGGNTVGTTDMDLWQFTIDAGVEGNGWNAFAAFVWTNTDIEGAPADTDDLGWLLQGGIFLNDNWEVFARLDQVIPDDTGSTTDQDFTTLTIGVNDYIIPESHAAKFSADVMFGFDAQAESSDLVSADTGTGILDSADDSQIVLRLQFQLLY